MDFIKPVNQENLIRVLAENGELFLGSESSNAIERIEGVFSELQAEKIFNPELCIKKILNSFKENTIQKEKVQEIFKKEFGVFVLSPSEAERLKESLLRHRGAWVSREEDTILCLENLIPQDYTEEAKSFLRKVIEEIIQCSKEGRSPDFEFLRTGDMVSSLTQLHILFDFLDYASMDEFQKTYLEPFNVKFPWVDLKDAPPTIKQLNLRDKDVAGVDFTSFERLEKINLSWARNLAPEQIGQISTSVETLELAGVNVAGMDFNRFTNLKEINFILAKNLAPEQIEQISTSVEILKLSDLSVFGFNFSRFTELKEIFFSGLKDLIPEQIEQISEKVKKIDLIALNVFGVDFRRFADLEEIDLRWAENLTPKQIEQISTGVKKLILSSENVLEVDFTRFANLQELRLKLPDSREIKWKPGTGQDFEKFINNLMEIW